MNKNSIVLLVFSLVIIVVVSCKKRGNPARGFLVGTWKQNGVAIDSNTNNVIDSDELIMFNPVTDFKRLVLNNDGTGEMIYLGTMKTEISWAVENNDTYLKIGYPGQAVLPTYHRLDAITASNMTYADNSYTPMRWALYVKQ